MLSSGNMLDLSLHNLLVQSLPQQVLKELEDSLNIVGPCNWKELHNKIKQGNNIFSNEDNNVLDQYPEDDSSYFLSMLCHKELTCQLLTDFLSLLPCNCSLNILNKSIVERDSRQQGFSLPLCQPSRLQNLQIPFNSLPPALSQTKEDSDIRIIEHPKSKDIDVGEDVLLRCVIQSSHQSVNFQWYHMFTPIPDQNRAHLIIDDAQLQHEGYYCCWVSTPDSLSSYKEKSDWAFISVGQKNSNFHAKDKFALLIANEVYANHKRLPAATRDVQELTKILEDELNFKTLSFVNLTFSEMHRALKKLEELVSKGSYCVFYFGGHGYETDAKCYMVPTDAPCEFRHSDCVNAHTELENIQRRCHPQLLLILLDICRKRNATDDSVISSASSFLPNVVLAYATTETREAFERTGQKHGIFVESLRRFITKPDRVNHMLSDVQDDVKKSCLQISEVRSTLTEDRCLTDRMKPDERGLGVHTEWLRNHDRVDSPYSIPIYLVFGKKANAQLTYRSLLTNKIEVSIRVFNPGNYSWHNIGFDPNYTLQCHNELLISDVCGKDYLPHDGAPYLPIMHVSNLQKEKEGVRILIVFQYTLDHPSRKLHTFRHPYVLRPRFLTYWNETLRRVVP